MLKSAVQISVGIIIMFSGIITFLIPELIDEIRPTTIIENEEVHLLGLQEEEEWLVIVVDFPDYPSTDSVGINQAENILNEQAVRYIDEMSGGKSILNITVHEKVITANGNLADYGSDYMGNIDYDESGKFLPPSLAQEAITKSKADIDWEKFDLDSDGSVDRLLILHTTTGQEDGGGSSDRIWSHFSELEDKQSVGNSLFVQHYALASLKSPSKGLGTMIHEMLHQLGAADLYPVHDANWANQWKGLGQWDIMASGNWNGNGAWPALPTSASLELMGIERHQEIELAWPANTQSPCIGPTIDFIPMSEGGESIKIQIGIEEYIWIEAKGSRGFESNLPGSDGILVSYQDLSMGDIEDNELNIDPDKPWLAIIEADGDSDLRYGRNEGEDSDLFRNGDKFGYEGIIIRNSGGVKVHWTAEVTITENNTSVSFISENCDPKVEFVFPGHESILLDNQNVKVETNAQDSCIVTGTLTSTDGRELSIQNTIIPEGTSTLTILFNPEYATSSSTEISGILTCGTNKIDIEHKVEFMGSIPINSYYENTILVNEGSIIQIPLTKFGNDSEQFTLDIEGPLSRIAEVQQTVNIAEVEFLEISIDPSGLLSDGMLVKGEIELYSRFGEKWVIEIELTADDNVEEKLDIREPNVLISAALVFLGLSFVIDGSIAMYKSKFKITKGNETTNPNLDSTQESIHIDEYDAWGRLID